MAKDVAEALAFKCVKSALKIHCQSKVVVRKGVAEVVGLSATSLFEGSASLITLIPESDVYRLVMRSNLPSAQAFQDWVCGTVLPAIRKDGAYILGEEKGINGK